MLAGHWPLCWLAADPFVGWPPTPLLAGHRPLCWPPQRTINGLYTCLALEDATRHGETYKHPISIYHSYVRTPSSKNMFGKCKMLLRPRHTWFPSGPVWFQCLWIFGCPHLPPVPSQSIAPQPSRPQPDKESTIITIIHHILP